MRIKCPNSDIVLELPGDRTDMKFTCPACHKIHRVTVSITTPGEDSAIAPTGGTRSVTRSQPQMPKKYATGAYAPVVDIPIDANFILLDGKSVPQGIDLGKAAAQAPSVTEEVGAAPKLEPLSAGDTPFRPTPALQPQTEPAEPAEPAAAPQNREETPRRETSGTSRVHQPPPPSVRKPSRVHEPDPNDPDATVHAERPTKTRHGMMWDDMPPPPPPLTENEESSVEDVVLDDVINYPYPERPRPARPAPRSGGAVRSLLFLLLLGLLGFGGYLGYQQYGYGRTLREAVGHLDQAESAWQRGDTSASGRAARDADNALRESEGYLTPDKFWSRLGSWSGLFSARESSSTAEYRRSVREYLERERQLSVFQRDLDASSAADMAERLRGDTDRLAGGDPALRAAMEKAVVNATVGQLREEAKRMTPEEARAKAYADRTALLSSGMSRDGRGTLENEISSFVDEQRRRLVEEVKETVAKVAKEAGEGRSSAMKDFRAIAERIRNAGIPELSVPVTELGDSTARETLVQLSRLSDLIGRAETAARSVLSQPDEDDTIFDDLMQQAKGLDIPNPAMAAAAAKLVDDTRAVSDDLVSLRVEVYSRLQSEMRRNREYTGTRLAWGMLRAGFDDPLFEIDPSGFKFDSSKSTMKFSVGGIPAVMEMDESDYEKRVRATVAGYTFTSGWALMFHKPLMWMVNLTKAMRDSGIDAGRYPVWEVIEGPGGPLAITPAGVSGDGLASLRASAGERHLFFEGNLYPVAVLPQPEGTQRMVDDFRLAARGLEEEVMSDEGISQSLRQALKPVLMGTYQQPDPRDYFDSAFCRRLIEADYLETYIDPMPAELQWRLDAYREALDKMEAGFDEFSVELEDGRKLYAVVRPDAEIFGDGKSSDQDPETGETVPRYTWRIEGSGETIFYSPQPARFIYAFMLAEHYPGEHKSRPAGVPQLTEVWHATRGLIASYQDGAEKAEGDEERWNAAVAEDTSGRFDPSSGAPGWNYPLHVLQRDDQGDPVLLATLSGTVKSPDFSHIDEPEDRREAEDEWLDTTAATLSTPGELGLIFHQFFRYCSDSPLPELPNLIGSHFGLSDTHQTVYESLERRWVGRLIGDCDDLAEFFQVLTRRQGKLSHVMQLPGHAAAGYVERLPDGAYQFIVLQTGPVLQFTGPTLNDVVEMAYRSFDRGDGISHMTTDAVPLLLRFANEETRTPFVLSARIYDDAEYADTMIQVQAYWHEHVYSAALKIMEELVETDKEIGNIKELGSLYERVGFYDKSEAMRRQELSMVRDNPQASMSTLLEIVQLHIQERNREKALEALGEMEEIMLRMIRNEDAPEFFRNMTFRSYWAMYLARLNQADRAWKLVRYDVTMTKRQLGRVAEPVLRTLVLMYDRMCMQRDAGTLSSDAQRAMEEIRKELDEALGRGYFKSDDSYNNIIGRYFILGRYAVADLGREEGLALLRQDGPYATEVKDQTKRTRGIDEEDWMWFRITPQLYYAMGTEMLDQDEYPELYNPEAARPMLEDVARAVAKGTGLGSDVAGGDDVVKADLTLAFLNNDLYAFREAMTVVKTKNYSSLYDDAAMTFGLNCGLVPLEEFDDWAEAFHEFFPGSQHYFKVVYRAIDKEHYDHALIMAEATARFFPDNELLLKEAEFVRSIIPGLKERKRNRPYHISGAVPAVPRPEPAAAVPAA